MLSAKISRKFKNSGISTPSIDTPRPSREPYRSLKSQHWCQNPCALVELAGAERDSLSLFFFSSWAPIWRPCSQAFLAETVGTGDQNRDDFHCMQIRLVMSMRLIFGDDWIDACKLMTFYALMTFFGRNPYEGNKPETEQFVFLLFTAWCMVFKRQDGPVLIINTD